MSTSIGDGVELCKVQAHRRYRPLSIDEGQQAHELKFLLAE